MTSAEFEQRLYDIEIFTRRETYAATAAGKRSATDKIDRVQKDLLDWYKAEQAVFDAIKAELSRHEWLADDNGDER